MGGWLVVCKLGVCGWEGTTHYWQQNPRATLAPTPNSTPAYTNHRRDSQPFHVSVLTSPPTPLCSGAHAAPAAIADKVAEAEASSGSAGEGQQAAFNPETGEINWACPCLGGMADGPCGPEFKAAFSCFVYSEVEPKGVECVDKFRAMQDCFRKHPDIYGNGKHTPAVLTSQARTGVLIVLWFGGVASQTTRTTRTTTWSRLRRPRWPRRTTTLSSRPNLANVDGGGAGGSCTKRGPGRVCGGWVVRRHRAGLVDGEPTLDRSNQLLRIYQQLSAVSPFTTCLWASQSIQSGRWRRIAASVRTW